MIYGVVSSKGGVGKSSLVANLGLALAELGYKTLVVDANLTNGNLSCLLGTPIPRLSIQDVILKRATLDSAIFDHPRGIKLLSSALSLKETFSVKSTHLKNLDPRKLKQKADIVLVDTPGTLGENTIEAMKLVNNLIIVTNQDVTSYTDAVKTKMLAKKMDIRIAGAVLNKSKIDNKKAKNDVYSWLGLDMLANLPFDGEVPKAGEEGTPTLHYNTLSGYTIEVKRLAAAITKNEYNEPNAVERMMGKIFRKKKY